MAKNNSNKSIVKKDLYEMSDAILNGVQIMFNKQDKKIDKRFKKVDSEFSKVRNEIKTVEIHLKDEIDGLKADLSTTVSKKEFNQLKRKVDILTSIS